MKDEIQLEDFRLVLLALWKQKIRIILVTLIGLFAGLLFTINKTGSQVYGATASVYCATYGSEQLSFTEVSKIVNYSDVVSSKKVCEYAASLIAETSISADEIQRIITMNFSDNSYVMKIHATHYNPEIAIKVVNAVAEAFVSEVSNITGNDMIQILDEANSYYAYEDGESNKIRLLFTLGALILACGVITFKELLSNKVRSIAQCIDDEDEILGIIPHMD